MTSSNLVGSANLTTFHWCNGSITVSKTVGRGSNPRWLATLVRPREGSRGIAKLVRHKVLILGTPGSSPGAPSNFRRVVELVYTKDLKSFASA